MTGLKHIDGNNLQIGLINNVGKSSLFSRMSPNNTVRSPIGQRFGQVPSGDALGTLRTQASTGVMSNNQQNANSSSTINANLGNKTMGSGMKGNKNSGMASPFKEALQKGVVSGVGMLTF